MEERYSVRFSVEPACSDKPARKVKESIRIRKPVVLLQRVFLF